MRARCSLPTPSITPGYDRELIAPGIVRRVYEAFYAKVLETNEGLERPDRHNMTPRTLALFDPIFHRGMRPAGDQRDQRDQRKSLQGEIPSGSRAGRLSGGNAPILGRVD